LHARRSAVMLNAIALMRAAFFDTLLPSPPAPMPAIDSSDLSHGSPKSYPTAQLQQHRARTLRAGLLAL
jgi:hypothetical protein